ncbi:hypothetical protein B5M42_019745 [Paenibacillus athensensis]|uniref:Iron reductase n=1 Tax=Paenibacillus athensensis TaxID=1967502 RepID=A0A4Y8Q1Z2_9BACL|nr:hypothetical protein [Paenibacillus athensensis]MCD1261041.1 hypothetical protein [Paenibacillus athensensis]
MAALYFFFLNLLVFAFKYVAGDLLPKIAYIYMGIAGTVIVIISLGYVLRKRYLKKLSRMKTWLDLHVLTGSFGSFLIFVHSEFHFRALLPSLTLIAMQLVVISGVIGRYLISHLSKRISQEKALAAKAPKAHPNEVAAAGARSARDEEDDLMVMVFSVSVMKHWKLVHVQLTAALTILIVLHVISELYYRGLRL